MTYVVAVDGPSGSGKSSVCRQAARQLNLAYLDTGAMYRAATWWCWETTVELSDAEAVYQCVKNMPLHVSIDPDDQWIRVGSVDVTDAIRDSEISSQVSAVATNLAVRQLMKEWQQGVITDKPSAINDGWSGRFDGIIAEGRDITTVVAPDAPVRVLLTASEEARLGRRALDVHGEAGATALAATRDQVVRRDSQDSTVSNFTSAAPGVVTIDSSDMTFDQTVDRLIAEIKVIL